MTFVKITPSVRTAYQEDRQKLANLIHFERFVHRHLDWRPALDWIGYNPYLIVEQNNRLVAALACPPDPAEVAWIRLFAAGGQTSPEAAWQLLWPEALEQMSGLPGLQFAAALPLQGWFQTLLEKTGFQRSHNVVMLSWDPHRSRPPSRSDVPIRIMNWDDMTAIEEVDRAAFLPVWRNSKESLALAFQQAAIATVVEDNGRLAGYQITTATPLGGHLARLAIHPDVQGQGVGYALVDDMLSQFGRRGAQTVTVNTQHDNGASLSLYRKAGFKATGESYPMYEYVL